MPATGVPDGGRIRPPANRERVAQEPAAARDGRGPTVFDRLVDVFEARPPGALVLRRRDPAGSGGVHLDRAARAARGSPPHRAPGGIRPAEI